MFLVRKMQGSDSGELYAMKVLKKATLKGASKFQAQIEWIRNGRETVEYVQK